MIMTFCPLICLYFWIACDRHSCSMIGPLKIFINEGISLESLAHYVQEEFPKPTSGIFQNNYIFP